MAVDQATVPLGVRAAPAYGRAVVKVSEPSHAGRWYADADDRELMACACREDDQQAFGELVRRHQHRLYTFALRCSPSEHDAAEIVQDSLFAAWQKRTTFRGECAVTTWLYAITRNRANNLRARRAGESCDIDAVESSVARCDDHLRAEQRLDILSALAALSTEMREVAVL